MIINFNKKVYNIGVVKTAIKAYQNLADFELEEGGKYIKVCVKKIKDSKIKDLLEDEFCNYVLFLMK